MIFFSFVIDSNLLFDKPTFKVSMLEFYIVSYLSCSKHHQSLLPLKAIYIVIEIIIAKAKTRNRYK